MNIHHTAGHSIPDRIHESEVSRFYALARRRLQHEPLQNLVGCWPFRQLPDLLMVPPNLVPRPETETLVDLAVDALKAAPTPWLLEVGCGSGAASLAVLDELQAGGSSTTAATAIVADISPSAIAATVANAVKLGNPVYWVDATHPDAAVDASAWLADPRSPSGRLLAVLGDVMAPHVQSLLGTLLALCPVPCVWGAPVVVSNPPYVSAAELADMHATVTQHEDLRALLGDPLGRTCGDGLSFTLDLLRQVLPSVGQAARCGQPSQGLTPSCAVLELGGPNQVQALVSGGEWSVESTHMDLAGTQRFAQVRQDRC